VNAATLVLPTRIEAELREAAELRVESGAVLLAGTGRTELGLRLLGRELHWVSEDSYERRTGDSLRIRSSGYVAALGRAEDIGAVPIWVHTHPGRFGRPFPSEFDEVVDEELAEAFQVRSGADVYSSLVVSPGDRWLRFTGRVVEGDNESRIGRLFVSGPRWALLGAEDSQREDQIPELFDRQVRAFGGDVQRMLSSLRVGIAGCGGTGSAVGEQLVRLGVRSLLLLDPDVLSDSNVTRVYGSTPGHVGEPKVDVLARHLRSIGPDASIDCAQGRITNEDLAQRLTGCDVIFGCTDDNAGRLLLSRLSSYYLTPVIDVGVLLSSAAGQIEGIDGRVTVLTPGEACLVCRGRIDLARAQAEQLQPDERSALQAEGYAPELGAVEPAVVPYTSMVASLAVAELLERFIGYGPDPEPSELLARFHERELSTNSRSPTPRHYCDPNAGLLGAGERVPFLGQTWG
jgi:molybdopterin/thiamine biosynthesis adenylyltransferase